MENPKPLKYDTQQKRRQLAIDAGCGRFDMAAYQMALDSHAAPLEQLIAEKDKTIADLREALEKEYEILEDLCNEDDAKGRGSYWVAHYRLFQQFLATQINLIPKPQL